MPDSETTNLTQKFDLALSGVGFRSRLERCWETRPFFCKRILEGSLMREFSRGCVEDAVWHSDVLRSRTEAIEDGKRVQWSSLGCVGTPITVAAIQTALQRGLTILVRRFDLEHPASRAFAQSLATLIGMPVFGTLFMAPRPENAFPAHYDSANVFAFQIAGAKRWELFEQVSPLPLSDAHVNTVPARPAVVLECHDTTSGDMLYVPRGVIHEVCATSCPSFHISFGALAGLPAN